MISNNKSRNKANSLKPSLATANINNKVHGLNLQVNGQKTSVKHNLKENNKEVKTLFNSISNEKGSVEKKTLHSKLKESSKNQTNVFKKPATFQTQGGDKSCSK